MIRTGVALQTVRPATVKILPEATYRPVLSLRERKAYQAAHRIMALTDHGERMLACEGARKSRRIDRIAQIVLEAL